MNDTVDNLDREEYRGRLIILWLPVILHLVLMGIDVLQPGAVDIGRLDIALLVLVLGYFAVTGWVARHKAGAMRLASMVWTVVMALAITEGMGRMIDPPLPRGQWLPQYPGKSILELKDAIPGQEVTAHFSVNRYGVRGPDYNLARGDLNILCVGGSTTECRAITDEESWPWRLQARLSEQLGKNVLVGNAGRSGHFVPHHRYQLERYTYVDEFDWAVVLVGINDLGRALHGDYERRMPGIPRESLLFNEGQGGLYYRRLFLVRKLHAFLAHQRQKQAGVVVENYDEKIAGIRANRQRKLAAHPIDVLPDDFDASLKRYRTDLEALIATAKSKNIKLLMLTQPTTWQADMSPEMEALLCAQVSDGAYTSAALARGIEALNRGLLEVAEKQGVHVLDLAGKLKKSVAMMYDDCHLTSAGCKEAARAIAEKLTAIEGLPQ